jgi:hypothetical protein
MGAMRNLSEKCWFSAKAGPHRVRRGQSGSMDGSPVRTGCWRAATGTQKFVLDRVQRLSSFPGYAQIHRVAVMAEPWTVENGLLTPTMKLKRTKVIEAHKKEFEELYAGH